MENKFCMNNNDLLIKKGMKPTVYDYLEFSMTQMFTKVKFKNLIIKLF